MIDMDDGIFVTCSSMPPYEEYIEAIKPLWRSHILTNMGQYHQELEGKLKEYLQVPELSLMVNGHMALELTIQAFGFPDGAEVITTPFTFISTTHAIVRNRLNPVFCDIKPEDGTIDETKIEDLITDKTVAIIPVHIYGNVCNVEAIQKIAKEHNLKVIYDAAHAFGVKYKGKGIGNYGDASVFSFHATKVYNTIEGGAVTFSDYQIYKKLYNLKNFGIQGKEIITDIGANAKMNEFSAIMGLCNLKHINKSIEKRKQRYDFYVENMKNIKGIRLFDINKDITRNYAYFPIIIESEYGISRNDLYNYLQDNNIYARKYFYPLTSDQRCYENKYSDISLKCAREIAKKILVIPFYENLEIEKMHEIVNIIRVAGLKG